MLQCRFKLNYETLSVLNFPLLSQKKKFLLLGHFNKQKLNIHFCITLHEEHDQVIDILNTGCNINILLT